MKKPTPLSVKSLTIVVFFSILMYVVYATTVLKPSSFTFFSLIDDGQTIDNVDALKQCVTTFSCERAEAVIFEKAFGRFRPLYWVTQMAILGATGLNPTAMHIFRVYVIGISLLICLHLCIARARGSVYAHVIAPSLFFANVTFTENIVRLGPGEPYQLLLLCVAVLLFFSRELLAKHFSRPAVTMVMIVVLTALYLTKETSIALIPALVLFLGFDVRRYTKADLAILVVPFVVVVVGKLLAQPNVEATNYIEGYQLSAKLLSNNFFSYAFIVNQALFPWFVAAIAAYTYLFVVRGKLQLDVKQLLFWFVTTASFSVVLLPWKYVLDRYLFITIFCVALVLSLGLGEALSFFVQTVQSQVKRYQPYVTIFLHTAVIFLLINAVVVTQALQYAKTWNYVTWYAQYLKFERSFVEAFSRLPATGYLNAQDTLDNWEVQYELPIHLHYLEGKEVAVKRYEPSVVTDTSFVLLSSSSLGPILPADQQLVLGLKEIERQEFVASQLDTLAFSQAIRYRPLQAIMNPPLKEPIVHYWYLSTQHENTSK